MIGILTELTELLSQDKRLVVDGKLLKNKVIELGLIPDPTLLKALLSVKGVKKHFFQEVDGILVFDKIKFQKFVSNKAFLPDSYTAYRNKIGLINENGEYFSDSREIVLAWPFKDCLLEGGQTLEDQKRQEIFWNETLSPNEIDRLLAPKVFTNLQRYGGAKSSALTDKDKLKLTDENLLIKGNNLITLASLQKIYAGKVKCIYIDPPYNPDSKANTFSYNNSFNESSWLTFMKNRIEAAKALLTKDGVFVIAIDANEQIMLGALLKEIFCGYEIHCITVVHNPRGVQGTNFSYTHEFAYFIFPEGKKAIGDRKIEEDEIEWSNFRNWGGESKRGDAANCFYPVIVADGQVVGFGDVMEDGKHPKKQTETLGNRSFVYPIDIQGVERKWRYARQTVDSIRHLLKAKETKRGYEIEIGKDFGTFKTVWQNSRYDANEYGTKVVSSLVPKDKFSFPKSLYTVYDCVHAVVGADKNAIVLDFFGGSGTTAHAVIEMNKDDGGNRKFVVCEQMDYVESVTRTRIADVIKGTKGSFVYCELMELNEVFVWQIEKAKGAAEVQAIWKEMQASAFLSYRVDPKVFSENIDNFLKLDLKEQKRLLIEMLDKNQLYLSYSEIEDADFKVSAIDKKLNRQIYGEA